MNDDHQFGLEIKMNLILSISKLYTFNFMIIWIILLLCTSCIPNNELNYPSTSQDFSTEAVDPILRTDAMLPELELESTVIDAMIAEDMLILDLGTSQPILRTTGVDFIGEPQSTYNGVETTIRGRYLWVLPKDYLQSDLQDKDK